MKNTFSYLITGGYGLIGSSLINDLEKSPVTILTRSSKGRERITRTDITILEKNLESITPDDLQGIDVIYHCASTVDNYHILTNPYIDTETNMIGTIKLLEACKNLEKKPRIIFLSTFFVYGNEFDKTKIPVNEETKTDPLALYPITKLAAENVIKLYGKLYNIPYLICRLTNVYSEFEDYTNKKKGAFNYLIMKALKGETLQIYKNGNFFRDYIYLEDVISALRFLENKNVVNQTFLIGYGTPVLFKELITYLQSLTGKKSIIEEIDPPEFHKIVGINNFVANTKKINALGWHAQIDYKKGIKKIVDRYKKSLSTQ